MGTALSLENEINQYLALLTKQQKQTVLTVVKSFAKDETAWWEDKAYLQEMDKRLSELRNGAVTPISIDDLVEGARKAHKSRQKV